MRRNAHLSIFLLAAWFLATNCYAICNGQGAHFEKASHSCCPENKKSSPSDSRSCCHDNLASQLFAQTSTEQLFGKFTPPKVIPLIIEHLLVRQQEAEFVVLPEERFLPAPNQYSISQLKSSPNAPPSSI